MPCSIRADTKFKFIVLEGVDGSGKSTVAKRLAEDVQADLVRTPPPDFLPIRHLMDTTTNVEARFLYYLSSVCHTSDFIRKSLYKKHVICDRYFASTLACHRALGLDLDWDYSQLPFLRPDFSFLLDVIDERERQRRLAQRGELSPNDCIFNDQQSLVALRREYARLGIMQIDTR